MKRVFFPPMIVVSVFCSPAASAEDCKDGWCKGGCDEKRCVKVKLLSKNQSIATVELSNNRGIGKAEYDCGNYMYRFIRADQTKSDWKSTAPDSAPRITAEVACSLK